MDVNLEVITNKENGKKSEVSNPALAFRKDPYFDPARKYGRKRVMGGEQEYGITASGECKISNKKGFLDNGARFYVDCGHPEYASPEASNPLEAALYDKAGELLVVRNTIGNNVRLYKNNTDGKESYASHESYSLQKINLSVVFEALMPFFVTRTIFAGSGIINSDGKYELSQRAKTTEFDLGDRKAIITTRDEPLADANKYTRLQIMGGDANMAEPAIFLKFGTTSLVLDLFEDKKLRGFNLRHPVDAFKQVSRDLTFTQKYDVRGNGEMTAIEIQRVYHDAAKKAYHGRDVLTDDVLERWGFVLDSLSKDPMILDRWIDWVIKKKLIEGFVKKSGKKMDSMEVRNIDLQYHELNRENGLFYRLQDAEMVDRMFTDEQVELASRYAPQDTRARIRGFIISNPKISLENVNWHNMDFVIKSERMTPKCVNCPIKECAQYEDELRHVDLPEPLDIYSSLEEYLK